MKIAKLDHIDLHYRVDNPNGRPVVFANSLTPICAWDAVLPVLPQDNCYIHMTNADTDVGLPPCPLFHGNIGARY